MLKRYLPVLPTEGNPRTQTLIRGTFLSDDSILGRPNATLLSFSSSRILILSLVSNFGDGDGVFIGHSFFLLSVFQYLPTVTSQSTMKRLVKTALLLAAAPYLAKKNSKAIVPYLFFSFLNIVHTAPRKWWLLSSFLISIFLHKLSTSWKKEKRLVATSATADQVPRKHSNPHTQTHTQTHTHTHAGPPPEGWFNG